MKIKTKKKIKVVYLDNHVLKLKYIRYNLFFLSQII